MHRKRGKMASSGLKLTGGISDKKEYALLNLDGGLEVLLISNRDVPGKEKKCAAAMACEVGSFSDPVEVGGLSHFLEHMLFMGSAKYPGENEYDKFISDNGGYDNAFTEGEHTVYNFEIGLNHFDKALDIFAQSFISATLLQQSAKREIMAIENEFQLACMSDGTRLEEVMGQQVPASHFLHKFGWGNLQSLDKEPAASGVDVMEALRQHYATHYRPESCKLVVLSSKPLADIELSVRRAFSSWPEAVSARYSTRGEMHSDRSLAGAGDGSSLSDPFPFSPRLSRVCSVKSNVHELKLLWVIPSVLADYRSRIAEYLGHLIGHEGAGGILSALRRDGLATDITAGVGSDGFSNNSHFSLFEVTVDVTLKGCVQWPSVIEVIFQYILLLQESGPVKWIFDELQQLGQLEYDYMDEKDVDDLTRDLAIDMTIPLRIDRRDLLWAGVCYAEWDPDGVTRLVDALSADRCQVFLTSSLYKDDGVTPEETGVHDDGDKITDNGRFAVDSDSDGNDSSVDDGDRNTKRKRYREDTHSDDGNGDDDESDDELESVSSDDSDDSESGDDDTSLDSMTPDRMAETDIMHLLADIPSDVVDLCTPPHLLPHPHKASTTTYFGAKYWTDDLPESVLQRWRVQGGLRRRDGLHLPVPNMFIPTELTLFPRPASLAGAAASTPVAAAIAVPPSSTVSIDDSDDRSLPLVVLETPTVRVWHVHDYKFQVPKVAVRIRLLFADMLQLTSMAAQNPFAGMIYALNDLFVYVMLDAMNEYLYMANMASLHCDISPCMGGVEFHIYGFSDKAAVLAQTVLKACCCDYQQHITPQRVRLQYEKLCKSYRNSALQAGAAATIARELFVLPHQVSKMTRLDALKAIGTNAADMATPVETEPAESYDDAGHITRALRGHMHDMLQACQCECLVQGNVTESSALAFGRQLEQVILMSTQKGSDSAGCDGSSTNMVESISHDIEPVVVSLDSIDDGCVHRERGSFNRIPRTHLRVPPSGKSMEAASHVLQTAPRSDKEKNICVEVYFDVGLFNVHTLAILRLIEIILEEPYFDHLRTKQQLGYEVSCQFFEMYSRLSFSFRVVSSSHTVPDVRKAMLHFIRSTALTVISDISSDQFESYAVAVLTQLRTEATDINESADPFWVEISDNRYCYHRTKEQIRIVPTLTQEEVLRFYMEQFIGNIDRAKLENVNGGDEEGVEFGVGVRALIVECSRANMKG